MLFPYLDTPFETLARVYKTGAIAESSLLCRIRVAEVHKILGLSCRSRRKVPDPAARSAGKTSRRSAHVEQKNLCVACRRQRCRIQIGGRPAGAASGRAIRTTTGRPVVLSKRQCP